MDISQLKEQLGDETFADLQAYITDLEGQRDSARKESINHRHSLKQKAADLEEQNRLLTQQQTELFERLGVESADQLNELDPKGQAEAAKQFEAKLKRIERELSERQDAYQKLEQKHKGTLQEAAMRQAMAGHEWIDADLVASFVTSRLVWDDDAVRYKADDGLVMDLGEGLKTLAHEKPHLLKTAGAGGSGYRGTRHEKDAGPKTKTRADFEALNPAARMDFIKGGGKLTD